MVKQRIVKTLSANDTGQTGGHQAGLLIPKKKEILSFFPNLDGNYINPRAHLVFMDDAGQLWEFAFIYYNNLFFGGTRNEYRLTRMTAYLREAGLAADDEIILERTENQEYLISYQRKSRSVVNSQGGGKTVLKLSSSWKVIDL